MDFNKSFYLNNKKDNHFVFHTLVQTFNVFDIPKLACGGQSITSYAKRKPLSYKFLLCVVNFFRRNDRTATLK